MTIFRVGSVDELVQARKASSSSRRICEYLRDSDDSVENRRILSGRVDLCVWP